MTCLFVPTYAENIHLGKSRRMPVERPSAFSGNKRPHNQLGLVPAKKLKPEGGELVVV